MECDNRDLSDSVISAHEISTLFNKAMKSMGKENSNLDFSGNKFYWEFSYGELFDLDANLSKAAVLGDLHFDISCLKDDLANGISDPRTVLRWLSMVLYAASLAPNRVLK